VGWILRIELFPTLPLNIETTATGTHHVFLLLQRIKDIRNHDTYTFKTNNTSYFIRKTGFLGGYVKLSSVLVHSLSAEIKTW